jgi:PAS domain S-box-containing protein
VKTLPVMNLKQRGSLVVGFPVLCQLIFVIVLGFQLYKIQNFMLAETVSQDIIRLTYGISDLVVKQLILDYSLVEGGSFITPEEGQSQWLGLTDDVARFTSMLEKDPLHKETLKAFNLAMEEMNESIAGFKAMMKKPNWKQVAKQYTGKLIAKAPSWNTAMTMIVAVEEAKVTADTVAIEKTINSLVSAVGVFACINIAIAAALAYYFAVMVSGPLGHIRNNAKLLSQRQPLLPQLQNAAEFSTLDSLLHVASETLESALLKNKELVDNAADIIVSANDTGEILNINSVSSKILGFDPADLAGQPLHSLAVPEQSFLAEEHLRNTMGSEKSETFDLQLRTASGQTIDTRWSCLWSQPHKKMFCVIHDVSEQKKVEQLKEDFANMISHDLRSPLMAMHNSLSLIIAGVKGNVSDEVRADISRGIANLDRLMQLVNDLLDFQKLKAGRMELQREEFDFREVARETTDLLSVVADKKGLNLVSPQEELIVEGDRRMLLQVLTNLVSNAIKFSPEGESITISAQSVENGFEFSVADCGKGIAEENRDRVFETFEQESRNDAKQGTGLGLAICKLIVEAHQGKIWVESASKNDDKGSIFRAFIPDV